MVSSQVKDSNYLLLQGVVNISLLKDQITVFVPKGKTFKVITRQLNIIWKESGISQVPKA